LPGGLPGAFSARTLAESPTLLVAVSGRNNAVRVFDGTAWQQQGFGPGYGSLQRVVYGADRFALIGSACCGTQAYAGLRATSTDGLRWMAVTNALPGALSVRFDDLVWDGARFLATASQYDRRAFESTDGLAWSQRSLSTGLGPVAFLDGTYVAANTAILYRS